MQVTGSTLHLREEIYLFLLVASGFRGKQAGNAPKQKAIFHTTHTPRKCLSPISQQPHITPNTLSQHLLESGPEYTNSILLQLKMFPVLLPKLRLGLIPTHLARELCAGKGG
ncbi:hypothetical protein CDAR_54721 [Caerostris darwini]|uniref:Uncharacterized protein n=1 Tax=Caerostris darwini TaxID=1538125 RepID=A0AAV4S0T4_9ARAC|nr:hypothetical protein CDAR_54721 [Caerostris darwini]